MTKSLEEVAGIAADRVAAELKEFKAVAYETGSIARLANPENSLESKQDIINQRVNDHNFIKGGILDESGKDIFTGKNYASELFYQKAIKGESFVSDPTTVDDNGTTSVIVAAPLWEGGIPHTKTVGVIFYIPRDTFLDEIMEDIDVGNKGTAFMLSQKGVVIADRSHGSVGENHIEAAKGNSKFKGISKMEQKMIAGEEGTYSYRYDGTARLASYAPVIGTDGWSIAVAAAKNEFLVTFYIAIGIICVLIAVFIMLGRFIGHRTGKTFISPIKECVGRLELLAKGDLSAPVPVPAVNDETALLLNSLGATITNLKAIVMEIDSHVADLADGNLCLEIEKEFDGDFVSIDESFRKVFAFLSEAMEKIDRNAENVARSSERISKASQSLADGATDQASAIEELTATISDISDEIGKTSDNAQNARRLVNKTNSDMQESRKRICGGG